MVVIEGASGVGGAALVLGVVLLEALVLYVGYGTLEKLFGPRITGVLRGE